MANNLSTIYDRGLSVASKNKMSYVKYMADNVLIWSWARVCVYFDERTRSSVCIRIAGPVVIILRLWVSVYGRIRLYTCNGMYLITKDFDVCVSDGLCISLRMCAYAYNHLNKKAVYTIFRAWVILYIYICVPRCSHVSVFYVYAKKNMNAMIFVCLFS